LSTSLCVLAMLVPASNAHAAPGWSPVTLITNVAVFPSAAYVRLDPNVVANQNGCVNWNGWFTINNGSFSATGFENAKLTVALAAKANGKPVTIYSEACNNGYNNLQAIDYVN
jgi:hypothetical protein